MGQLAELPAHIVLSASMQGSYKDLSGVTAPNKVQAELYSRLAAGLCVRLELAHDEVHGKFQPRLTGGRYVEVRTAHNNMQASCQS